jgi:hypothetical protein
VNVIPTHAFAIAVVAADSSTIAAAGAASTLLFCFFCLFDVFFWLIGAATGAASTGVGASISGSAIT